jgi:uncharacterized LabA/DUF88 family protein
MKNMKIIPKQQENNFAFIDGQNLYKGIKGWKLDYKKFLVYLKDKYNVKQAYLHIGFKNQYIDLYTKLQEQGFILNFKPTLQDNKNCNNKKDKNYKTSKGNVDVDLAVKTLIWRWKYDKAVIITSDGDFDTLVSFLNNKNKLKIVLSPNKQFCSSLLQIAAESKIDYIENIKDKVREGKIKKKQKSTATRRNR